MSRGGWTEPHPNILFICSLATIAFNRLTSGANKDVFLAVRNHRATFVDAVTVVLRDIFPNLNRCTHMKRILRIYFNILSKNYIRNVNSKAFHSQSVRKINKLLSRSSIWVEILLYNHYSVFILSSYALRLSLLLIFWQDKLNFGIVIHMTPLVQCKKPRSLQFLYSAMTHELKRKHFPGIISFSNFSDNFSSYRGFVTSANS